MATRTALAKFKSQASTRDGFGHWKAQRLSSLALLPLTIWFAIAAVSLSGSGYAEAVAWLAHPINATLMALFMGLNFWHAQQGVQVIIEDYVHHEGVKIASLVALNFACVALGAYCIVAIARVAFGS